MTVSKPTPGKSTHWMIRYNAGIPYTYGWRDVVDYYKQECESRGLWDEYLAILDRVALETTSNEEEYFCYYDGQDYFIRLTSLIEKELGCPTCEYKPSLQKITRTGGLEFDLRNLGAPQTEEDF